MRVAAREIEIAENSRDSACLTDFLQNSEAIPGPHERLQVNYLLTALRRKCHESSGLPKAACITLASSEVIWQMTPP